MTQPMEPSSMPGDDSRETLRAGLIAVVVAMLVVAAVALPPHLQTAPMRVVDARSLVAALDGMGYRIAAAADAPMRVPRLSIDALPDDLAELASLDERKLAFLRILLPLVLAANEAILDDRSRLLELRDMVERGGSLGDDEQRWLAELATAYRVLPSDGIWSPAGIDRLLGRVDVVPPSLALAQAAVESAWGTSRFALEGNALFGQASWSEDAMEPAGRDAPHRIAAFATLEDSVAAYMANLNRHDAYRDFRRARAEHRAAGLVPDGRALAGLLLAYAETGERYVETLKRVIDGNGLGELDHAVLEGDLRTLVLALR